MGVASNREWDNFTGQVRDGLNQRFTARVTADTTDATAETIWSDTMPTTNAAWEMWASFMGLDSAGVAGFFRKHVRLSNLAGGTPTAVLSVSDPADSNPGLWGGPTLVLNTDGSVAWTVTGVLGASITWSLVIAIEEVVG